MSEKQRPDRRLRLSDVEKLYPHNGFASLDAKIWELSAKRADIMVAALFNSTAPRFWSIPNGPKINFESHSKTSTKSAPDCDLEPFLGRAPIGTLGPRLNLSLIHI